MNADDEFDAFLKDSLAPPATPDRRFVDRVSARVAAESLLRRRSDALLKVLVRDLAGLLALALTLLVAFRFAAGASSFVVLVSSLFLLGLWLVVSLPSPVRRVGRVVPVR